MSEEGGSKCQTSFSTFLPGIIRGERTLLCEKTETSINPREGTSSDDNKVAHRKEIDAIRYASDVLLRTKSDQTFWSLFQPKLLIGDGGGGNRTRVRKRSAGESTYLSGSDLSRALAKGTCKLARVPAH